MSRSQPVGEPANTNEPKVVTLKARQPFKKKKGRERLGYLAVHGARLRRAARPKVVILVSAFDKAGKEIVKIIQEVFP